METKNIKKLYETMLRIRISEESFVEPIIKKEIKTPVHLYSGQEAIASGVCLNLKKRDVVFGSHRSHGHYLAKGGELKKMVAEIYGKETGCSGGKGGSMHIIASQKGFLGSTPIVAGTISLALGASLAFKIKGQKNVAVSFFGDGATGEGVLYESLNFASLKKLPIIFVCENNFYSTHLPIRECRPPCPISEIAKPFKVRSFRIDGNDAFEVYKISKKAIELARKGNPVFIECLTYRQRGHVGPDDNIQGERTDIRPQKEVDSWKRKDPIKRVEKKLKKEDAEKIKRKIEKEVRDAHLFAQKSQFPKDLKSNVFK